MLVFSRDGSCVLNIDKYIMKIVFRSEYNNITTVLDHHSGVVVERSPRVQKVLCLIPGRVIPKPLKW